MIAIDDYTKDGGPGEVWLLYSFYHESLRTWIKTIVNKFAISNHKALILGVHALRSYLKIICEYELHSLPNKKDSSSKDHGKNHIKVRPPLIRHLLPHRLFLALFALSLYREETWMKKTAVWCLHTCGLQWYFGILSKPIFVNDKHVYSFKLMLHWMIFSDDLPRYNVATKISVM